MELSFRPLRFALLHQPPTHRIIIRDPASERHLFTFGLWSTHRSPTYLTYCHLFIRPSLLPLTIHSSFRPCTQLPVSPFIHPSIHPSYPRLKWSSITNPSVQQSPCAQVFLLLRRTAPHNVHQHMCTSLGESQCPPSLKALLSMNNAQMCKNN